MISKALKEYNDRVKAGEIERSKSKNPIEKAKANPKSLRAAINAYCYQCSCYQRSEVTLCEAEDCPLWHLRPWQVKEK